MTLTLAQARDVVEDLLDDSGNARWSTAQIDVGLGYGLSTCLHEYVSYGGDRFDIIGSFNTTTSGEADLSSVSPLHVKGLNLLVGSRYWPIPELKQEQRNVLDDTVRTLSIRYTRAYEIPSNSAHPLVGVGATAASSFDAFEHWVCLRAALYCSLKDAEARPEIRALEQEAAKVVIETPTMPEAFEFPRKKAWYSRWFGWTWNASTKKVLFCKRNG